MSVRNTDRLGWMKTMDGNCIHYSPQTFSIYADDYGLKNASATFQRAMNIIVSSVKQKLALVHLEDTAVSLKNVNKHTAGLR